MWHHAVSSLPTWYKKEIKHKWNKIIKKEEKDKLNKSQ